MRQHLKIAGVIICAVILTACGNKEESYLASVREFSWVSSENKPFLSENIFANECKMSVSDINADGIPEVILTDFYSPSEANAAEVFSWDGELSLSGGFWGSEFSESGSIPVYETADGRRVIVTSVGSEHGEMCGTVSIGNLPTMEMLSQPDFDAEDHIKHKDEPQSIEKADEKAADSICSCISEHFFG